MELDQTLLNLINYGLDVGTVRISENIITTFSKRGTLVLSLLYYRTWSFSSLSYLLDIISNNISTIPKCFIRTAMKLSVISIGVTNCKLRNEGNLKQLSAMSFK